MEKHEVLTTLQEVKAYKAPVFGADGVEIPNYAAVRTVKGDEPIAILGDGYALYNHEDAAKRVFDELDEGVLNYDVKNLILNGPNRMNLMVTFPEMKFDIDGSEMEPTLAISNSVDGTLRFSRIFGYLRLICTNGLMRHEKVFSTSRKHTKKFEVERFQIEEMMKDRSDLMVLLEKSQTARITKEFKSSLIGSGFPKRVVENWNNLFEKYQGLYNETVSGNTIWAIQAVLTNWLTNVVAKTNIDRANRLSMALNYQMRNHVA
ncbi:DUF932 domain-containing protein [Patescibacteria group bacterium]|nr:DUF932 domain-containing protein [Patescibacteria group bacterium]